MTSSLELATLASPCGGIKTMVLSIQPLTLFENV